MRGKKVLIADDEPLIVDAIAKALKMEGYDILRANNGQDALQVARSKKPDLILLDIKMPVMDGVSACKTVRSDPFLKSTPVIMITAMDSESNIVSALEAGADDYIIKPFRLDEIKKKITKLLGLANSDRLPSKDYFERRRGERKES